MLDEAALIELLQAGKIAGAGARHLLQAAAAADNPLWRMPNVIITPNIGGRSDTFVEQTLTIVEPNLRAFVEGRLNDLVNIVRACGVRRRPPLAPVDGLRYSGAAPGALTVAMIWARVGRRWNDRD